MKSRRKEERQRQSKKWRETETEKLSYCFIDEQKEMSSFKMLT